MSLVPVYRPRPSPLHAARAGATAALLRRVRAGVRALRAPAGAPGRARRRCSARAWPPGVGAELRRAAWLSVPLALLIALINPLVYQGGDTLLVRGGTFLGRRFDITLEALAAGGLAGLRVVAFLMAFGAVLGLRRPRRAAAPVPPRVLPLGAHRLARHPAGAGARARRPADGRRRALPPAAARPAGRGARGAGGRARPRGGRGGGARGARLLARRAARARGAAAVVAPRPAGARRRPLLIACVGDRVRGLPASARSSSTRRSRSRSGLARAC